MLAQAFAVDPTRRDFLQHLVDDRGERPERARPGPPVDEHQRKVVAQAREVAVSREKRGPQAEAVDRVDAFAVPRPCRDEQSLLVIRRLGLPMDSVEEQFRRMAFNVIARNQDDHVKNIAFVMDKAGRWALSPAFDVTYNYNRAGVWTASHQMSMNGKRDRFTLEDFKACAKAASMKRGRAQAIVGEVRAAVVRWLEFADRAGVVESWRDRIQRDLRLEIPKA